MKKAVLNLMHSFIFAYIPNFKKIKPENRCVDYMAAILRLLDILFKWVPFLNDRYSFKQEFYPLNLC